MSSVLAVLHVDRDAYRVFVGAREVHLPLKEFQLLCYLVDQTGRACRHGELVLRSGMESRESVKVGIAHLRRALGPMTGARIATVRAYGYRIDIGPGVAGITGAADSLADGPHADSHRPSLPRRRSVEPSPSHPWRRSFKET